MADGILSPRNVARGSGIMTLNSPSGNTMQCEMWLWDDVPFNSHKRLPLLEFYFRFPFRPYHCSRHVILHQSATFYPHRIALAEKNDVMSIFKMAVLRHFGF